MLNPQAARAMHKLHESADGVEEPIPGVEDQEGEEDGEEEGQEAEDGEGKQSVGQGDKGQEEGGGMGLEGDTDGSSGGSGGDGSGWARRVPKRGRVIDEDEDEEDAGQGQGASGQAGAGRDDQWSLPGEEQHMSPRWLQPWERPGAGACYICGKHGHWTYTCPRR